MSAELREAGESIMACPEARCSLCSSCTGRLNGALTRAKQEPWRCSVCWRVFRADQPMSQDEGVCVDCTH